jgi:hypothetical protein
MKINLVDACVATVLILLGIFVLVSCEDPKQVEKGPTLKPLQYHEFEVEGRFSNIFYVEFQVDGCEYIHFYNGDGSTIHKPTCKNHVRQ